MGTVRRVWRIGRGRWWRPLWLPAALYLAVSLAVNALLLLAVGAVKLLTGGGAPSDGTLPSIHNVRKVDDRVWAGAQAGAEQYRQLAATGVTVVVDLRTGAPGDAGDDAAALRSIGLGYVRLPLRDGHAPDAAMVRRFLEVVREARGIVYVHCGGGVGRSYSLQAAYEAAMGRDPSVAGLFVLGPPTVEQLWFVLSVGPGRPVGGVSRIVEVVSRFVFDAPRTAINWVALRIFDRTAHVGVGTPQGRHARFESSDRRSDRPGVDTGLQRVRAVGKGGLERPGARAPRGCLPG